MSYGETEAPGEPGISSPTASTGSTGRLRPPARPRAQPSLPELKPDPIGDPIDTVSAWNIANAVTVFRLLLVPVFAWLLLSGNGTHTGWRVAAFLVFALAAATDRLDGELARRRKLITEFGKLADPVADKALTGTALVSLAVLQLLWWWVTVVVVVRELGITALRLWVLRHGVIPASRGGKVKTLLQSIAIGLLVLPLPAAGHVLADAVMIVAVVVTLVTGVDYVGRAVRLRRVPPRR